ncbi:hypothetical protein UFOVP75_138 [uncultured Caudovirales phage]|uniref:Uncharacterized protein n=1 Tax=uncultured Caudovirales phage TaxID=2100421 RepID=A0A6J5KZ33_9CAUD|nr:hypothetical protein UFOVP75_138 [uncultured Caudovirales phage]
MPSTFVSQRFAPLKGDGRADGLLSIDNNAPFLPGATIFLISDTQDSLECIVAEQVGAQQIRVRAKTSKAQRGSSDVSAYLAADHASVSMEGQVVPVEQVFFPRGTA